MDRSVPAEGGVTSLREVCPSCTNSKLQLAGIKSVMIPHPMQCLKRRSSTLAPTLLAELYCEIFSQTKGGADPWLR